MTSSPLFWLFALALAAGTLVILVLPLVRRARASDAPADRAAATAVFRDHKRQVEEDFAARSIDAAERDAALADLTARFGKEIADDAPVGAGRGGRSRYVAALAIVACIPIVAATLYFSLGNPAALSAPKQAAQHSVDDPQMAAMVDALATKLQASPEDGLGWAMLGRSYRALGRFDAASMAFGEAAKRLPPDAAVYADWAETVAQAQGKTLAGQPTDLLNRALAVDPDYPKALALAGSAALERNDPTAAAGYWKRLRAGLPPGDPNIPEVDAALTRLGAAGASSTVAAAMPPARAATPAAPAAAAPQSVAAASATTAGTGQSVEGRVELDPKLAGNVGKGDTVFILARDPTGSRVPLAVIRTTVGELPKTFAMDDGMAMSPAAKISGAKQVVVEARVSKSGNVSLQPGDMSGASAPVPPGTRGVKVTIDRVAP